MNRLVFIINKVFSVFYRIIKWMIRHWSSLRKALVIFLIIGALIHQLSSPDIRKKINNSTVHLILQYEQEAISLEKSGKLSDAIDSYKNAIAMISSQKESPYFDMDDEIQYRIYKNTALLILNYSKFNTLTNSQKSLLPVLIEQLEIYKNKLELNTNVDKIISGIILLQNK